MANNISIWHQKYPFSQPRILMTFSQISIIDITNILRVSLKYENLECLMREAENFAYRKLSTSCQSLYPRLD